MSAAIQIIQAPFGALPAVDAGRAQGGELLEFTRKETNVMSAEQPTQLEAENAILRRELQAMQQALMQKDVLLKNARVREMELRSHLARLLC